MSEFHSLYGAVGFPSPGEIRAIRRDNTGAGRFVDLASEAKLTVADGYLDMGGRHISLSGVPNGLMAIVAVDGGKITQLEIAVYGEDEWDGHEGNWRIV